MRRGSVSSSLRMVVAMCSFIDPSFQMVMIALRGSTKATKSSTKKENKEANRMPSVSRSSRGQAEEVEEAAVGVAEAAAVTGRRHVAIEAEMIPASPRADAVAAAAREAVMILATLRADVIEAAAVAGESGDECTGLNFLSTRPAQGIVPAAASQQFRFHRLSQCAVRHPAHSWD
eukprot:gnl/TRDRNA2_/TRDRNA2_174579_c0_seq2.p1 gnl/TRDRNA2_/TRDRNA2_174579_c0~~gnl/TRDRNA2_/TRDRNA2_174579_c0_seq2.p1  ORF type:complete len:175 (-),score=22.54 gnl/TRDRNA2_/TRDRNA2_174579_c0_seq2:47-571(-)